MSESIKNSIAKLYRQLAPLVEERDRLDSEAREWATKRNSLHEKIKKRRAEFHDQKQKRDTLNKRVQDLKTLREEANENRNGKHAQVLKVRQEIRTLLEKKPSRSMGDLQKEIEKLEWRIQTNPLSLKEEEIQIEQIRTLETQLMIHKKLQKLRNNLSELQTEEKKLQSRANNYHTRILELAKQSQELHKKMLDGLNEVKPLQDEADRAHKRFTETKEKSQGLSQRIELIRGELHRMEDENRARHELELRKGLEERALEKLKRGEKLTWEEFKALAEKGKI